jgi:hypothetical protein
MFGLTERFSALVQGLRMEELHSAKQFRNVTVVTNIFGMSRIISEGGVTEANTSQLSCL